MTPNVEREFRTSWKKFLGRRHCWQILPQFCFISFFYLFLVAQLLWSFDVNYENDCLTCQVYVSIKLLAKSADNSKSDAFVAACHLQMGKSSRQLSRVCIVAVADDRISVFSPNVRILDPKLETPEQICAGKNKHKDASRTKRHSCWQLARGCHLRFIRGRSIYARHTRLYLYSCKICC